MVLSLIAAIGKNKEIGYQGSLPWRLPTDLTYFKSLTSGHTVIMGRNTYESIGKPLPDRVNIVLTKDQDYTPEGCLIAHSLNSALALVSPNETESFVIGGAHIFAVAISYAARMYITQVDYSGPADTYFPAFNTSLWKITPIETPPRSSRDQYDFRFVTYDRITK
jgi:dihydrofolate reductase